MKEMIKKIMRAGLPIPSFVKPLVRFMYYVGVLVTEGLIFLRKFFFVEPVLRSVAQVGCGLWADRLPYMRGRGRLIIGNNVRLSGRSCFYFMNVENCKEYLQEGREEREGKGANKREEPVIEIGDNVFIGNGCTFSAARRITIADHALISTGVRIHDNDGHPKDPERRKDGGRVTAEEVRPVMVGENAWIGAGAIILKGVSIGKNAIIGAGAVVTSDVTDGTTAAGNPSVALSYANANIKQGKS